MTESDAFSARVAYIWQTLLSEQTLSICIDLENYVENTKSF